MDTQFVAFDQVLDTLNTDEFTVDELTQIADVAQTMARNTEARFAKVFDLGDRVQVLDRGVFTVVRRNKWTVTVADKEGNTEKIRPSDIEAFVESGDPDSFDYFDYFGETGEDTV